MVAPIATPERYGIHATKGSAAPTSIAGTDRSVAMTSSSDIPDAISTAIGGQRVAGDCRFARRDTDLLSRTFLQAEVRRQSRMITLVEQLRRGRMLPSR